MIIGCVLTKVLVEGEINLRLGFVVSCLLWSVTVGLAETRTDCTYCRPVLRSCREFFLTKNGKL